MATVFIDSNVFLRHLLGDHPDHSPRATALLALVASGRAPATTASTAIMDVVSVLDRTYRVPRAEISAAVTELVAMERLEFAEKAAVLGAPETFSRMNVPFVDALHVALARAAGVAQIATFDRHVDRFGDIERVEP